MLGTGLRGIEAGASRIDDRDWCSAMRKSEEAWRADEVYRSRW